MLGDVHDRSVRRDGVEVEDAGQLDDARLRSQRAVHDRESRRVRRLSALRAVLDEDDLPADSFLDGDFSAFADESLTHDEFGDIIPAPAPAFEEVDGMPPARPFRLQPSRVLVNPLDADVDALFAA
jgi:hypothetical protein